MNDERDEALRAQEEAMIEEIRPRVSHLEKLTLADIEILGWDRHTGNYLFRFSGPWDGYAHEREQWNTLQGLILSLAVRESVRWRD